MTPDDPIPTIAMFTVAGGPGRTIAGPGFSIDLYEHDHLIGIKPVGRWNLAQAEAYRLALRGITGHMIRAGGYKGALFDVSDYPEQSPEVIDHHVKAMKMARFLYGVKAAVLAPNLAARQQAVGAAYEACQRSFWNPADAMDWLQS